VVLSVAALASANRGARSVPVMLSVGIRDLIS
jgi:hypothetical protein